MSTSQKSRPPLGDEQLRKLDQLLQALKKAGYTKTEVVDYVRRHFPPDASSRDSGPNARTFPSIDQIRETPEGGEKLE